jgi:hypothetical protein
MLFVLPVVTFGRHRSVLAIVQAALEVATTFLSDTQ